MSGTSNLTAGVVGCGRMGAFSSESMRVHGPDSYFPLAHAEAIEAAEGLDLVALCDSNGDSLSRAGERYGVERRYADYRRMLAAGAPDLLGIATRTIGRADIMIDAIEAGTRALHVEKPMCSSMEELSRLEALLDRADVFVTLGALRRHLAIYREALAMAKSGRFGELKEAFGEFGERTLYWSHPHTVDLILMAASGAPVQAVEARLGPVEREGMRILNDPVVKHATIHFQGGFMGHVTQLPGTDFRMATETAQIAVVANGHSLWRSGREKPAPGAARSADPAGDNPYHEPERLDYKPPEVPQGALAPIMQLVAALHGQIPARQANHALKRDILTGQKILFAIVQSHLEGGRPVDLGEIDPAMFIEARSGDFYA